MGPVSFVILDTRSLWNGSFVLFFYKISMEQFFPIKHFSFYYIINIFGRYC